MLGTKKTGNGSSCGNWNLRARASVQRPIGPSHSSWPWRTEAHHAAQISLAVPQGPSSPGILGVLKLASVRGISVVLGRLSAGESRAAGFGILFWNPMAVRPEPRLSPIPGVTAFCTQQTVWAECHSPFQKETCGPCPLPSCTHWCPLPKQPRFPIVQLQWARIWGAGPKLAVARSVWVRQKRTAVTGRRGSWSWQFLRRGCQFPLQFKESFHLSASECGMGSWPKRCGWEPGPRRRGRTRVPLRRAWGENLSTRQERRGKHVSPSHPPLPGPILCQESGKHSPHFLD